MAVKHLILQSEVDAIVAYVNGEAQHHGPFNHDLVRDEKNCDRCKRLKRAQKALRTMTARIQEADVERMREVTEGAIYGPGYTGRRGELG